VSVGFRGGEAAGRSDAVSEYLAPRLEASPGPEQPLGAGPHDPQGRVRGPPRPGGGPGRGAVQRPPQGVLSAAGRAGQGEEGGADRGSPSAAGILNALARSRTPWDEKRVATT